jgi:hypothetical protein
MYVRMYIRMCVYTDTDTDTYDAYINTYTHLEHLLLLNLVLNLIAVSQASGPPAIVRGSAIVRGPRRRKQRTVMRNIRKAAQRSLHTYAYVSAYVSIPHAQHPHSAPCSSGVDICTFVLVKPTSAYVSIAAHRAPCSSGDGICAVVLGKP